MRAEHNTCVRKTRLRSPANIKVLVCREVCIRASAVSLTLPVKIAAGLTRIRQSTQFFTEARKAWPNETALASWEIFRLPNERLFVLQRT